MVHVGIVGAGNIGRVYAEIIAQRLANATIVSVTDANHDRGRAFARAYGAQYYQSIEDLLKDPNTDTVAICAPTHLHAGLFKRAAAAGKNIFCDKPIAMNLSDAEDMRTAARRAGIKVMVGHVLRFWPEYVYIKNFLESGKLGRPLHAVAERLCPLPDWWDESIWFRDEQKSGGVAFDAQIHDLDYLAWIFGKVKFLNCSGVNDSQLGGLRHLCTSVTFANGVSAMVQVGWGLPRSFPFTMVVRVVCEQGTIEWIFRSAGSIHKVKGARRPPIAIYHPNGDTQSITLNDVDPYFLEWKYFTDQVDTGGNIEQSTLDDGYSALKLVIASIQSAKEMRSLEIA